MWQAYLAGESGLVHSATGSGKTLAADTVLSMDRAVKGLGLPWTVGLRTGDTSSAERARQARKLPSALVTTPESLSLMLSNADSREKLSDLRLVVVDEWHELLGNKRGVMTELGLARLRQWNPKVRTWGLSATLGNIEEALERLIPSSRPSPKAEGGLSPSPLGEGRGEGEGRNRRVVKGVSDKKVLMDTLIPPDVDQFPWAGHLGLVMLDHVVEAIESSRSTLVFTNVRSQAEIWYQGGVRCIEAGERLGPFVLNHEPGAAKGGEKSLRLPCFWFGSRFGVLPAFGAFTGNAEVLPRRGDQVFVIAEQEVLQVA